MEQIKRLLGSIPRRQLILIAVIALAVAGSLTWFLYDRRNNDYRPVYTGLAAEDAGQVVNRLKEATVEYRLAENGGSILVRSAKVAEVRLLLASAGLPKSGRIGFELFDKTNFGGSDFAEQVNFRRAMEGELERSIISITEVEQARVHITFAKESVFTESRQPAKASVLLKIKQGAELAKNNVTAIGHLVANAVEGLAPDGVSIVDMKGNLLTKPRRKPGEEDDEKLSPIEFRKKIESDLLAKIYSTLEPVLGPEHFRAGVAAEVDFTSGEQSEETWDPNRSVMVTQQRSEEMNAPSVPSGVPGTASNLPRPTSRPGPSSNGILRRTENITYQSSRTVRRTKLPEGGIRRLSVSAILDQQVRWDGTGAKAKRILEPPSEETLKKVRDLVAGAVGFNQERGDQIVVQSLPFESTLKLNPAPADPKPVPLSKPVDESPLQKWLASKNIKVNPMILVAVGGAVVLVLIAGGFLLLRKRRKQASATAAVEVGRSLPGGVESLPAVNAHSEVAVAATVDPPSAAEQARTKAAEDSDRARAEAEVLRSIKGPEITTKKAEVLIKQLVEQAKREPTAMAQLMRSWIQDKG